MPFTPASPLSVAAFVAIVVGVVACFVAGTYYAERSAGGSRAAIRAALRFSAGAALWLACFAGLVASGLVERYPVALIPVVMGVTVVGSLLFGLSGAGRRLSIHLPLQALVLFQAFRLPLELVLHSWSEQGTIPSSMTWSGSNVDIVSGIVALALAPFAARRLVSWIANVVGISLLVNVARVAILSTPVPFGWNVEPKLLVAAHLPYAFIAPVCVAGAIAGHVILTRRLLGR